MTKKGIQVGSSHIGDLDDKRKDVVRAPRCKGRRPDNREECRKQEGAGKSAMPTSTAETETPAGKSSLDVGGKGRKERTKGDASSFGTSWRTQARQGSTCLLDLISHQTSTDRWLKRVRGMRPLRVSEHESLRSLPGVIAAGSAGHFWLNLLKFDNISNYEVVHRFSSK